jgi:hypothetical protein
MLDPFKPSTYYVPKPNGNLKDDFFNLFSGIPPQPIDPGLCPRHDEIRNFLCSPQIRGDLAIDTMNFVIPEHSLLGYIVKYGRLQPELQPDEWRNFLIITHHRNLLFSYVN